MALNIFKSRGPKKTEEPAAAPEPVRKKEPTLPPERILESVSSVLTAVPSLPTAKKVWRRVGFRTTSPFKLGGCRGFDISLEGADLRFLAPTRARGEAGLRAVVGSRLVHGAGPLGWTWSCEDMTKAMGRIAERSGVDLGEGTVIAGSSTHELPPTLNPGAFCLMEETPKARTASHYNQVTGIDHIVLNVTDVERAAAIYQRNFGLSPKSKEIGGRTHAFLKAGETVIELVGMSAPRPGPVTGNVWGLAFRSSDLDSTVEYVRKAGLALKDARTAIQGGRIASLPMPLGGIHLAFLGE